MGNSMLNILAITASTTYIYKAWIKKSLIYHPLESLIPPRKTCFIPQIHAY